MYRQLNAEQLVILVNITRLVPLLQNLVLTAALLQTHAVNALLVNRLRHLQEEVLMIAPGTRTVPAQSHHPAPVIADTAPMLLSLCQPVELV